MLSQLDGGKETTVDTIELSLNKLAESDDPVPDRNADAFRTDLRIELKFVDHVLSNYRIVFH